MLFFSSFNCFLNSLFSSFLLLFSSLLLFFVSFCKFFCIIWVRLFIALLYFCFHSSSLNSSFSIFSSLSKSLIVEENLFINSFLYFSIFDFSLFKSSSIIGWFLCLFFVQFKQINSLQFLQKLFVFFLVQSLHILYVNIFISKLFSKKFELILFFIGGNFLLYLILFVVSVIKELYLSADNGCLSISEFLLKIFL